MTLLKEARKIFLVVLFTAFVTFLVINSGISYNQSTTTENTRLLIKEIIKEELLEPPRTSKVSKEEESTTTIDLSEDGKPLLLVDLGLYKFSKLSMNSSHIPQTTEVIWIVITRWNSFDVRQTLREMFDSGTAQQSLQIKLVFLFNYPSLLEEEDFDKLANESQNFQDMLIPSVEDNYHTVGLKLLSALNWITTELSLDNLKWITKSDDDMMVNFTKYDEYFTRNDIDRQALHCPINIGMPALRDPNSKWYVQTIEWLEEYFPKYCSGSTYTMPPSIAESLFVSFAATLKKYYIWIEDVYITGILAGLNNVEYVNTYDMTHFGVPDNNTEFMTCHVSGLSPGDWIKKWHEHFDV